MDIPAQQRLEKRTVIFINVAVFVCLVLAICALVGFSIRTVSNNADELDDRRSLEAVGNALAQTRKQIENTVRDNAFWDDAVKAAYVDNDIEWMINNWGIPSSNYPLYDVVLVVDAQGKQIFGYDRGQPIATPIVDQFDQSFALLVSRMNLRTRVGTAVFTESAFLKKNGKTVVLGVAPILPSTSAYKVNRNKPRFLIFLKDFAANDIADLGESYAVAGLHLNAEINEAEMNVPLLNPDKAILGYISWPRQVPGSKSLVKVTPTLAGALALLLIFIGVFIVFTRYLINNLKQDKLKAQYASTHDSLSGLYNRAGILRKLDRALLSAARLGMRPGLEAVSLVYLDLDGFKDVNDSYGHSVGDSLIRHVATKIRALAPTGSHVARLGGDEFAVIIAGDTACQKAGDLACAIHRIFKDPFQIDGRAIVVGASIGISTTEDNIVSSDELVRQADVAMYRAKDMGRGRTILFEASFDDYRSEQFALETDLGAAIMEQQIDVAFQPLVDAKTSVWHGVEALARWHNKRLDKNITPDVFIPIAERSGLIEALGLQVLEKSLIAAQKWPGLKVSVNVSPAQFRNPAFPDHVRRIIDETGFDAKLLTLEITEGFFIRQPERAQRVVRALKDMGISISLDDFGSGYSSLGYLRKFQFDRLKIDRSLVTALDHEANAPSVILATVALANAFNIPVTAEGIEREEQASILRLSGCDEFQGFLFGKPMLASEIGRHLDEQQLADISDKVA